MGETVLLDFGPVGIGIMREKRPVMKTNNIEPGRTQDVYAAFSGGRGTRQGRIKALCQAAGRS